MDNLDISDMFGLTDGWSASPDDLIDSFLTINGDFFKELDDSQNMQFNAISEANLLAMQHQQQQQQQIPIETQQQQPQMNNEGAGSAVSSLEPSDFHGFLDGSTQNQLDLSEYINFGGTSSMGGLDSEPVMSSRSSDSGLSSDNMEMDMSPDYEPLSPAMSSPGPSISERGGKNSPARSVVSEPGTTPSQEQQQPTAVAPIVVPTPVSAPVAAPVAAPMAAPLITIKTEPMPLFQPMVQKPLSPAQPQAAAKLVATQPAPIFVAQKPQVSVAASIVASPMAPALPIASKPPQKTLVFNSSSPNIMTTNTKPRYVIEKTAGGSTVIVSESQIISPTAQKRPAPVQTTAAVAAQQPPIKKEVKFYKMAPSTMIQSPVPMATAVTSAASSAAAPAARKFTTIQSPKPLAHPAGTYVINKSATGNFSGVRKLVRVQQSPIGAQNGTGGAARSILLPVSFQDVKDFRTIKIINASNLNNKQPISANIKLAAANLLQQSKQGLVQKNVCFSKEQLMDDSVSDVGASDAESYVCEDRRSNGTSKSSSVVSVAVAAQPKPIAHSMMVQQQSPIIHRNVIINRNVPMSMAKLTHITNNNSHTVTHHQSASNSSPSHSDADDSADDDDDASDYMNGVSTAMSANGTYPKLQLTNEERRLLDKECISLPDNYPLTKHEERELKRIRRKIRNKISAQDSRKRKKEYVDGLEERVKQCTDENQTLIKRLKLLQSQHTTLSHQVKKLQAMLQSKTGGANGIGAGGLAGAVGGAGNKMTQPATCLMVLLLSLALVAAPNLKLGQSDKDAELVDALQEQDALLANRRNLLFDANELVGGDALADDDLVMMDEVVAATLNGNEVNEHDYAGVSRKPRSFVDFDLDDAPWRPPSRECGLLDNGGGSGGSKAQKLEPPTFAERAAGFQETLRAATPRIVDFECGAKIGGGGGVGLGAGGMYEVKLEPLESILAGADGNNADAGKKLNESAKAAAGDGQGRHTILMQGA